MFVRLPLIAFALAAVSANPADELRTGIQFLEAGNPELALAALERAAERSDDPGLVAFNRGVALVQLNRHREAELQFLHCLDDGEIPAERRATAIVTLNATCLHRAM